jgi:hypothetical protein
LTYRACPVEKGLRRAKRAISAVKNATGRQLARVSATQYGETVWSELYPGSRPSASCLQPAVLAAESSFDLAPGKDAPKTVVDLAVARRRAILWRLAGGFGSDEKMIWLLARDYQAIGKGFSGRRAENLSKQVARWNPYGDARLGAVTSPVNFGRDVQVWIKRRVAKGEFKYSYYLTTVKFHCGPQPADRLSPSGLGRKPLCRQAHYSRFTLNRREPGLGRQSVSAG